jgi:hypothetical protein
VEVRRATEARQVIDPGHTHGCSAIERPDTGFDINEHLAALPASVRGDYTDAIRRSHAAIIRLPGVSPQFKV